MKKSIFLTLSLALVVSVTAAVYILRGLSDFDLNVHSLQEISFETEDAVLSGTLVMPRGVKTPPIALIVHGDGAQDRFSSGGYLPLINALVDEGIGVFSWDKAGVEASSGNWLDQTMNDRADEALAARDAISALEGVNVNRIGFLGFSQAGWVLPRIADQTVPAFTVIVGGAVSWRDQGIYYSRVRMLSKGVKQDIIAKRLADRNRKYDALFDASTAPPVQTGMDATRFKFVADAYWENSTETLSGMKGPLLAIWGEGDQNVDAHANSVIYKEQLAPLSEERKVIVVPNATHGLLRADLYNYQLSSDWPWYLQYIFLSEGRNAFAPESISQIINWIIVVTDT